MSVRITFDGREIVSAEGQTVAAALFSAEIRSLRTTLHSGEPRGYFCGMGVCNDCLVTIDGRANVRACMTPVKDGLVVESQAGTGEKWPLG